LISRSIAEATISEIRLASRRARAGSAMPRVQVVETHRQARSFWTSS
jgi:hypothetical protein